MKQSFAEWNFFSALWHNRLPPPTANAPAILPLRPPPAPQHQMQHGNQPCCSLHMQPLSVTMSSSEDRQLHPRLDVPAEASLFAARPLLLWAFQSSQWQLQAVFGPRPSLLRVSAAQSRAFGSHFRAKYRQSLLLQPPMCDACREVDVLPKRMRRHASAEASRPHSVAAPLLARAVGGGCSCGCRLRARHRQRRWW